MDPAVLTILLTTLLLLLLTIILTLLTEFGLLPGILLQSRWTSMQRKHVVIIGGSQGLGLEVAKVVYKLGANVTVISRSEDKLHKARLEIIQSVKTNLDANGKDNTSEHDQRVQSIACDCSNMNECTQMAQTAIRTFGHVDMLFLMAGGAYPGRFEELQPDKFEEMMKMNYYVALYPILAISPYMRNRHQTQTAATSSSSASKNDSRVQADIIVANSGVALLGVYGYSAYAPAKWALRGLFETLHIEFAPYNIRMVQVFCPDMDTPGFQEENKTKPGETLAISEGMLFPPNEVAQRVVAQVMTGKRLRLTYGSDLFMVTALTAGFSCEVYWYEVILMPILRIVSAFITNGHQRIVRRMYEERRQQAVASEVAAADADAGPANHVHKKNI